MWQPVYCGKVFSALTWFQNFVQSGCACECPSHILGHSGQKGIVACGFFCLGVHRRFVCRSRKCLASMEIISQASLG